MITQNLRGSRTKATFERTDIFDLVGDHGWCAEPSNEQPWRLTPDNLVRAHQREQGETPGQLFNRLIQRQYNELNLCEIYLQEFEEHSEHDNIVHPDSLIKTFAIPEEVYVSDTDELSVISEGVMGIDEQGEQGESDSTVPSAVECDEDPFCGEDLLCLLSTKEKRRTSFIKAFGYDPGTEHITMSPKAFQMRKIMDPDYTFTLRSSRGRVKPNEASDDLIPIILDTGASFAITNDLNDFIGKPIIDDFGNVSTVNGDTKIEGLGIIRWILKDKKGEDMPLEMPAHYIPGAPHRLFSPVDYYRHHKMHGVDKDLMGLNLRRAWFKNNVGQITNIQIDWATKLPVAFARTPDADACSCGGHNCCKPCLAAAADSPVEKSIRKWDKATHIRGSMGTLDESNENLTEAQKAALLDHQRLGHLNTTQLLSLYRSHELVCDLEGCSKSGYVCLPGRPRGVTSLTSKDMPMCFACQLSRARRRTTKAHDRKDKEDRDFTTPNPKDIKPGDMVSLDHYESRLPGTMVNVNGQPYKQSAPIGGTIFYDHASGLISVYHQPDLSAESTAHSKDAYEQAATRCGVKITNYHADNHIFTSREFRKRLDEGEQAITFSGPHAHHQNAQAERAIQTVVYRARAMMVHAQIMWPELIGRTLHQWTYALTYAAYLHNHIPSDTGISPIEIFCGVRLECKDIRRARVWGCPAFVLDPNLANGQKIPKWDPRSRRGRFLGFSMDHSTKVSLVEHLSTKYITPQYHVVYDEKFHTVPSERKLDDLSEVWTDLFTDARENILDDTGVPQSERKNLRLHRTWTDPDSTTDDPDPDIQVNRQGVITIQPDDEITTADNEEPAIMADPPEEEGDDETTVTHASDAPTHAARVRIQDDDLPHPQVRRSARTIRRPKRFAQTLQLSSKTCPEGLFNVHDTSRYDLAAALNLQWDDANMSKNDFYQFDLQMRSSSNPITREVYYQHPLMMQAKLADADTPNFWELRRRSKEEQALWHKAMVLELDQLLEKNTFRVIERDKAQKTGKEIVPSTWALRVKRLPDGTFSRLKARFCVRGDRQMETGRTRDETFAPVVDWGTLRLMFALSVQHDLHTQQIDFKNAFVQSSLRDPIYLELPPLMELTDGNNPKRYVLEVNKSLYGDRRAPRLWFQHLASHLESQGFEPSILDPCLFVKDGIAVVVYVDDAIIVSKSKAKTDEFLSALEQAKLDFTREQTLAGYLGIKIERQPNGELVFNQPALTQRVIAALNLTEPNCKAVRWPASTTLGRFADSAPASGDFNYRSVVGMLLYLANNTRPDIAFAVNQCARFSHDPKEPHEKALKRVGRYLLHTPTGGITYTKHTETPSLDCWVDADFAGLWTYEDVQDPTCVRSRTGYIIKLGNTPVVWASRLQTEVAMSTMESEYIALSTAMRALLPLRVTHQLLTSCLHIPSTETSKISTVWEDNAAAMILATTDPPRMTPRSKHIAVKYHWFRTKLKKGEIEMQAVASEINCANILTKALPEKTFVEERKLVMGW